MTEAEWSEHTGSFVAMILMSAWGGLARYLKRVRHGAPFRAWTLAGELAISGFAGFCAGVYVLVRDGDPTTAVVVAGIAGHMGGRLIELVEDGIAAALKARAGAG